LVTGWGFAEEIAPTFLVVPWNGHPAALSLTFDDGDPSHLDVALPELNARGIKATFFLIGNKTDRKDDWRKVIASGHEIGNHSLDHLHTADLKTFRDLEAQVVGAQNVLQKEFGVSLYTYAYPFTETTPEMTALVAKTHLLARGGWGQGQKDLKPDQEPDWMNLPSKMTETNLPLSTYVSWLDDDLRDGAWTIITIHGLEGTPWGYQPISRKVFTQLLDEAQKRNLWIDTLMRVGSYFRAQKILEKASVETRPGEARFIWKVPGTFPLGTQLRIQVPPSWGPVQKGKELVKGSDGNFILEFNQGEVTLKLLPKS
jgi:peptidoglycan/xylan/chitin deacetylase (PgdA/CDA1 family)